MTIKSYINGADEELSSHLKALTEILKKRGFNVYPSGTQFTLSFLARNDKNENVLIVENSVNIYAESFRTYT